MSTQEYFAPDDWYEPRAHADCACRECDEKDKKLKTATYFLEAMVKAIYSKDKLDINLFEFQLDELCYALGVEMNTNDIQIQRTQKSTILPVAQMWINYNTQHLQGITQ
jgi:hypothetical protein